MVRSKDKQTNNQTRDIIPTLLFALFLHVETMICLLPSNVRLLTIMIYTKRDTYQEEILVRNQTMPVTVAAGSEA
jgi:hypothetical protein